MHGAERQTRGERFHEPRVPPHLRRHRFIGRDHEFVVDAAIVQRHRVFDAAGERPLVSEVAAEPTRRAVGVDDGPTIREHRAVNRVGGHVEGHRVGAAFEPEAAATNSAGERNHRVRTPAEGTGGRGDQYFVSSETQRGHAASMLVVDASGMWAGGELDHSIILAGSAVWHDRDVRAVVQRVESAWVDSTVDGVTERVGSIGSGLMILVGVTHSDDERTATKMAEKIWNLRVMDDDQGVMNRSIADTTRAVLVVSQFTLYGDTSAGRRPSWIAAARPEVAEPLVQRVVSELERLGASVATGRFRTDMKVALVNDGPVTVVIEL